MRKILTTALAGVMLATSAIAIAPSAEARDRHHGGGYGHGYYGHGGRHHHNNAGAAIAGLAIGAIIGGAIASGHNSYYDNGYYYRGGYGYRGYDDGHTARCYRAYGRSYDPGSDTFIGRDGNYYYCRL